MVVLILIWTKNPLILGKDLFFFGLLILLNRNPPILQQRPFFLFFWSSPIFGTKKGATTKSRTGATIFSNASALKQCVVMYILVCLRERIQPISGRVNRASATETVDSRSIPGQLKPKTIKIDINSFPLGRSAIKGTDRWQRDSKTKGPLRCLLNKVT